MSEVDQTQERAAPPEARASPMIALFCVTGFFAALLLFVLEPMAAKALLPVLGGSPSVWNTAMAFFQVALLGGYATAHLIATRVAPALRRPLQVALIAAPLLVLPFDLPIAHTPGSSPISWELSALVAMVGAPFFVLATVSPMVQRWFSSTNHARSHDPFFLYAASNLGSFLGLLAYPVLVEPRLDLLDQTRWFGWGYGIFVLLMVATALVRQTPAAKVQAAAKAEPIAHKRRLFWLVAAAVPSLLLLGVTRHLATDVASFPLLWVVPLAIYLATFVVAFSRWSTLATRIGFRLLPLVAIAVAVGYSGVTTRLWVGVTLPLLLLTLAGLVAHGLLYSNRPDPSRLTEFYLWISAGGAIGGLLGALAAPLLFNDILEYPIAIMGVAALTRVQNHFPPRMRRTALVLYVVALVAVLVRPDFHNAVLLLGIAGAATLIASSSGHVLTALLAGLFVVGSLTGGDGVLLQERTFFGVYRVVVSGSEHSLVSGTTVHGAQRFLPHPSPIPLAYYHPDGPIAEVMNEFGTGGHVGLIGLGTGALAYYGQSGQTLTFYEIDPAVVEIAQDPRFFTYLTDTNADIDIIVGDGRLRIAEPHEPFALLIVDAFSSDAIPTHLLTTQAIELYLRQVQEGAVVGLHISNRHLDLEPVLGRIASELGLVARVRHYEPAPEVSGASPTSMAILARRIEDLDALAHDPLWSELRVGEHLWTDTYTDLLGIIRWR